MLNTEYFVKKFKKVKTLLYVVTELSRMIANDSSTMKGDREKCLEVDLNA